MDEPGLIQGAQQGDLDSFNRLVLTHQAGLYNVALRILGDADSAADATQEAVISAWRNIGSYRGGLFRAWLSRIVCNACHDQLRRSGQRQTYSLDERGEDAGYESIFGAHGSDTNPADAVMGAELAAAIQHCFNRIPDTQRIAGVMADMEGYSYKEIASATRVPVGTVRSRIARARKKVAECLRRNCPELILPVFRQYI